MPIDWKFRKYGQFFFKYNLPKLTKGKGNMKSLISVKGIQSVI